VTETIDAIEMDTAAGYTSVAPDREYNQLLRIEEERCASHALPVPLCSVEWRLP
jgi:hypothetical protein